MNDVYRVLEKLETIQQWAGVGAIYNGIAPQNCKDVAQWIDEAIELLKECKPCLPQMSKSHVMTLYEALNTDRACVYLETKKNTKHPCMCCALTYNEYDDYIYVINIDFGNYFYLKKSNYNINWRCWTSQPTKEQRQMEKWKT